MYFYLITALADYALATLILLKQSHHSRFSSFFLLFCIGTWSLELFFLSYLTNLDILYPIFHILRWGLFLIPAAFAFAIYNTIGVRSTGYYYYFLIPIAVMGAIFCVVNTFVIPSTLGSTDSGYLPKFDIVYACFLVYGFGIFLSVAVFTVVNHKKIAIRNQQRFRWIAFSILAIVGFGVICALLYKDRGQYLSNNIGSISGLFFSILFFYISSEENLSTLKLVVVKTVTKSAVVVFYTVLFLALDYIFFENQLYLRKILFSFCFFFFLIQTFPYLSRLILTFLQNNFANKNLDFYEIKNLYQQEITKSHKAEMIVSVLDTILKREMGITNYRIILKSSPELKLLFKQNESARETIIFFDDSHTLMRSVFSKKFNIIDELDKPISEILRRFNAFAFFPLHAGNQQLAIILIGLPKGYSYFSAQDMTIIDWLSEELGEAMYRLTRYKQMQEELAAARKKLSLIDILNQYHHDIKTPLSVIDGVVSTEIYDKDRQREIVLEQVNRGTKLIATMAKILRGEHNRKISKINIKSIISDCVYVLNSRFSDIKIESPNNLYLEGDAVDLKIMFINVIKNAAEAASAHRPLNLTINGTKSANTIHIEISDTGIGMAKEQLEQLWDNDETSKETGSGIGLQAIKRIADEHNVEISVESTEGIGTTFIFSFPAASEAALTAGQQ